MMAVVVVPVQARVRYSCRGSRWMRASRRALQNRGAAEDWVARMAFRGADTMSQYFSSSDVAAAHKELSAKDAKVNEVKGDLWDRRKSPNRLGEINNAP